jgi:hypothetical protein
MSLAFDHNRLIKKTAKELLSPHGIIQKGNSRIFLKDNGWYIILIEFQPSGFSAGTYLNISVDLNFYPRDFLALAYGDREESFVPAENEAEFLATIQHFCDIAINKVKKLESDFADIAVALRTVRKLSSININDPWRDYERAILYALNNHFKRASWLLHILKLKKCRQDFEFKRREILTDIIPWLKDKDLFLVNIKNLIAQTRQLKGLNQVSLDNLTQLKEKKPGTFSIRSLLKLKA